MTISKCVRLSLICPCLWNVWWNCHIVFFFFWHQSAIFLRERYTVFLARGILRGPLFLALFCFYLFFFNLPANLPFWMYIKAFSFCWRGLCVYKPFDRWIENGRGSFLFSLMDICRFCFVWTGVYLNCLRSNNPWRYHWMLYVLRSWWTDSRGTKEIKFL